MIGDTILFERTRLGMTQEKLSDYLHLTKATISKWENNQAKPDIDYLILMAKLFDMTLDELVGFQKTLTDSERGHLFKQLRGQIDQQNGTEFFQNIQDLAKHYINDNKTLLLLVQLVLSNPAQIDSNPWSLELINRIISKTTVESELQSAIMLKVVILFQQKKYDDIIALYQNRPYKLGEELFLANSFAAKGETEQAKQVLQVEIYQQILLICQYLLSLTAFECPERQEFILERLENLMTTFDLKKLHPNTAISSYYSLACYFAESQPQKAISYLNQLAEATRNLLKQFELHGDSFFDAIDPWLQQLPTGIQPPTNSQILIQRVIALFHSPEFQYLQQEKSFQSQLAELEKLEKETLHEH
ncbi:helix-turn-helix domain-containing protein [Streptococcus thermophilus]|uniref:helix-turn-helix domain-containing protein n=1 Tax=Streptococcus thermophilus TaxID=1308 RepID=UPI001C64F770|nr:helix-turn-helix transcriptional regulator [Streptococcus thermophilus]MBW7798071.1 helix-turn-helix domain-containing protein [Streptococcus thermophilus]